MEEAPTNRTQELARKFELLSEKTAEKHFPGAKRELNDALQERSVGGDEAAFWSRAERIFREYGVDEDALNHVLEER